MKSTKKILNVNKMLVASFVEAWIEILSSGHGHAHTSSPPSWRRGLKFRIPPSSAEARPVASFVEAWIEIWENIKATNKELRRLLRGGVD